MLHQNAHPSGAALVLLMVAGAPAGAQRITFPVFTGPGAAAVRNQLVSAVCDTAECVASARATTRGRPDWKKARKESVKFFVTGTVLKKKKALQLDLAVLSKTGPSRVRRSFPLERNGTLSPKHLESAVELLTNSWGDRPASPQEAVAPARPAEPVQPPPEEPPQKANATTTPPPASAPPLPPPSPQAPDEQRKATAEPEQAKPQMTQRPWLVLDVGVEIMSRKLAYSNLATQNLRTYELPGTPESGKRLPYGQPALGVQFFPLALSGGDLLAGLGFEVGFAVAPYLLSSTSQGDIPENFPTSSMRIDVGGRWNIVPMETFALSLSPYVGFRSMGFTVGPLKDGRRLDGLPNVSFLGLRAGLGLEVPLIAKRLAIFGRFGVLPTFGSGEIISSMYFQKGSTLGLEANGGLSVQLLAFLQVRASFEFVRYHLTFQSQATDTYVASGASDTYLGGSASLRMSL